jgi:hypothetical protein
LPPAFLRLQVSSVLLVLAIELNPGFVREIFASTEAVRAGNP